MAKPLNPYEESIRLEHLVELQKRVIHLLAHDIRNPLNSLRSLLQLMPENKAGLAQPGMFLEMAGNQLSATLTLLDNIVEWGQLHLDEQEMEYKDCQLETIVRQIKGDLEIQAVRKGLVLKNQVDARLHIVSDESRLRFILRNLVSNAIKFTKTGYITIDAALTRKNVLISVEDTGIGIPPYILESLFEGQKKASRKGTKNEGGSGLGLSLVKELVEKMEGSITVESEEGRGSVIAISLPCTG
jgi:signal transduction histidine kinase